MPARKRAARLYREADVPYWVALITSGIWLVVGAVTAAHYQSFDLPPTEANLAGFAVGGFLAAVFYLVWACD